jgi:predicted DNA-binding transcriptional regulator YafY
MRSSRLLAIQLIIQSRGRVTAEALAEEFEVSVRTIYRDIDALSAAGVPVYADRGLNGGFKLHEGYRTKLAGLTASEAEALALSGLAEAASDLGLDRMLSVARLKLIGALSPEAGAAAERMSRRVHLDPSPWYRRRPATPHLPELAEAVFKGRRIAATYRSWRKTADWTLDPFGLVLKREHWYLVARANGRIGLYRADGFAAVAVTADPCEPPADFNLAEIWREEVQRFEREILRETATLRLSEEAMPCLHLLGSAMADPIMSEAPDEAGWRQATVPIESVPHAARMLLGLGSSVEVLQPPALRKALRDEAEKMLQLYSSASGQTDRPAERA